MARLTRSKTQKQGIDMMDGLRIEAPRRTRPPEPPKRFTFLKLPLELRFHVLELLFATESGRIVRLSDAPLNTRTPLPGLAILQVSWQMYHEGMLSLGKANPTVSSDYSLRAINKPRAHFRPLKYFKRINLKVADLRWWNDCNSVSPYAIHGILIALWISLDESIGDSNENRRRIAVRLSFEHNHLIHRYVLPSGRHHWLAFREHIQDARLSYSRTLPAHTSNFTGCAIIFIYAQLAAIVEKHRARLARFPHIMREVELGPFEVDVQVLRKNNGLVAFKDQHEGLMGTLSMTDDRRPACRPSLRFDGTPFRDNRSLKDLLKW